MVGRANRAGFADIGKAYVRMGKAAAKMGDKAQAISYLEDAQVIRHISKSAFTYSLIFGILIANTEFVDEATNSINCFKVFHGKKMAVKLSPWEESFRPSLPPSVAELTLASVLLDCSWPDTRHE